MSAAPPANINPGSGTSQTAPYAVRLLEFTFQLGTGNFGGGGQNTLTIGGQNGNLRATAHIEFANMPHTGMAQFRIYGMTLDQMNQLSVAGLVFSGRRNLIACRAGDSVSGMTTVFNGNIIEAWPDIEQPDSPFFVLASPGTQIQLKPVQATSFSGPTQSQTAFQQIAQAGGLTLENNGVNAILQSPYFHGAAWAQLLSCLRQVDCFGYLDGINNKLAIWPKNGSRSGNAIEISPETGMIGYPKFQKQQTKIRVLFNPNIFVGNGGPGSLIKVTSQLTAANGEFVINNLTHDLASEFPDGPWETLILATPKGSP